MTPVQYWVYTDMGLAPDLAIRMAFATGLFVMVPTMAASAFGHHIKGSVRWKPALALGGFGLAGAFGGATLASHVPARPLEIVFGVTVLLIGIRIFVPNGSQSSATSGARPWAWALWALPIGFMAGLIGVGGGVFMVPLMTLVFGFPMHMAIGTSVAAVAIMSVGGIAGYVTSGMGVADIPSPSVGYVYIYGWLCLVAGSILMTQVGVRIAHRVPAKQLGWAFGVLALYVGLRMLGLFEWLGWPI